ncbi:uncharacterized protein BDR25DRAFT_238467 [Lindgomyces ingoldianus]|uniref:Uncharacterized protein n=1 Tax=Lindgomyces ingoldianus TaxID=673940 RepID=A0ACB6QI93_9PLEO|nr:uncharacterized protein BDR25DRAFT_238467 [Lindgomyces ingoldianus]KAF2465832.1 hypothetical protein BDR25DRAFT_238467 [Lindgomyces ingoldianus]
MDRASQALALGVLPGVSKSFWALADCHGSIKEKAQSQQHLYLWEEKALAKFIAH